MKQTDLLATLNNGEIIMCGTYWGGRIDEISFRDKQNGGQRRTAHTAVETILTEKGEAVTVSRFLQDNEKVDAWKPSAKRNDKVVVRIASMERQQGKTTLSGVVETLV